MIDGEKNSLLFILLLGKLLPHSNGVFSTSEVGHKGSWVRAQVDDKSVKGHPQTMLSQNRQLLTPSPHLCRLFTT